jgi:outer membrane protein
MSRSSFLPALWVCAAAAICPAVASAQLKVGVMNMQRAILDTAEIKKASTEMQTKFKARTDQLENLRNELSAIQAKLQNPQTPPAQQADLQGQGTLKQRQAQRIQEDLQADVERERNETLQKAAGRMSDVIKKMAEEKSLDLVVDITNALFFKPALDVTEEAIAAYDKTFPAK